MNQLPVLYILVNIYVEKIDDFMKYIVILVHIIKVIVLHLIKILLSITVLHFTTASSLINQLFLMNCLNS